MVAGANDQVEFVAYSAQTISGRLREVHNEHELATCLAEASANGWTVTIRAGAMAFDTHALNDGVVIQLRGFDEIIEFSGDRITVGANTPWEKIVEATRARGYLPYVLVSTEFATAGGTASADCLSRFSPSCGKEGNHVLGLRVMKVDGTILTCSREENGEVFRGAISGFGLLGVILSVTYRLLRVPHKKIIVKTDFTRFQGLRDLATTLVEAIDDHQRKLARPKGALAYREALGALDVGEVVAISGVVYMNARRDGFVMRSSYQEGDGVALEPSPFHQPKSLTHRSLQVLALFESTRKIGYWYVMNVYLPMGRLKQATDDLGGFTFFQGGNDAVRRAGRSLGLPMGIIQQTFIVPRDAEGPTATALRLGEFLEHAEAVFQKHGVSPPLIDVLYVPDDAEEGFPLSSNDGLSGYAVTVTFERPFSAKFPHEAAAFAELAEEAARRGGRVHLVKNVFASPATMERMYARGVERMRALKRDHDPAWRLCSDFVKRVLPSLAQRDGARGSEP